MLLSTNQHNFKEVIQICEDLVKQHSSTDSQPITMHTLGHEFACVAKGRGRWPTAMRILGERRRDDI